MTINDPAAVMRERVKASGTSFAAGMMTLPKARREAMYALYAFCREVDDIADDGPNEAERRAGLAQWRTRITDLFQGKTSDLITEALLPAVRTYNMVPDDFLAIIDGMEMDAGEPICAPTLAMLDRYCDKVASAVGRASVRIFGDSSEAAMRVSYHLGRALQLTNILRDLAEDAKRKRLYLPREILCKHGMDGLNPIATLNHVDLHRACAELAEIAEQHFAEARTAMRQCNRAAMRPARVMGAYYHAILQELLRNDWQDLRRRVTLPTWRKIWLLITSF